METKQEIFFVAQADNNDEYTFDLVCSTSLAVAVEFNILVLGCW